MPTTRRPFAALLAATIVSTTGNALTELGVPWFVLVTTGSAARAGTVAFCAMAPVVASSALLGPVVDRAGRRRVAVVSDLSSGAFTCAVPLLQAAGELRFWTLCLLMGLAGFCHAPGDTARAALVPDLAARSVMPLGRAAGLYDGAARCAGMLGAALGGVLITSFGPSRVLFVDAGTFAVSAGAIALGLRGIAETCGSPETQAPPGVYRAHHTYRTYRADLAEGIRIVLRTPLLIGICTTSLAAQGLDQGWSTVLLPDDVRTKLGSALALGLLETLFGLFAFVGALLFSAYGHRVRRRRLYAVSFLVVGAPRFLIAATTHSLLPLALMMAVEGLACGCLNPIVSATVYDTVPPRLRSRALGAMTSAALLVTPLGGLATGYAVGAAGLDATLLAVGALYLLVTLVPAAHPAWRGMDAARVRER
ncbi:MFS family permease [Catenulispora sp. GP43]|uniref:MFS transporter n=1 Tax=Catenulispora sp. GP43 TaxID=3156263 RepID=UPI0035132F1E